MKGIKNIDIKDNLCDLCGTCIAVCPEDCIEMTESRLIIDFDLCTFCTLCIQVCPVEALEGVNGKTV